MFEGFSPLQKILQNYTGNLGVKKKNVQWSVGNITDNNPSTPRI